MYYIGMEQQIFNQATYAKADGMAGERSLTYGVNAKGQHVVRIDLPAGEDIGPCIYRYATAEEAGRKSGETLREWAEAGYIPAEEYWEALRRKFCPHCGAPVAEEGCSNRDDEWMCFLAQRIGNDLFQKELVAALKVARRWMMNKEQVYWPENRAEVELVDAMIARAEAL